MKWLLTLCSEFSVPFPTASSDLFLGKLESVLFCLKDGAPAPLPSMAAKFGQVLLWFEKKSFNFEKLLVDECVFP